MPGDFPTGIELSYQKLVCVLVLRQARITAVNYNSPLWNIRNLAKLSLEETVFGEYEVKFINLHESRTNASEFFSCSACIETP